VRLGIYDIRKRRLVIYDMYAVRCCMILGRRLNMYSEMDGVLLEIEARVGWIVRMYTAL
jgi:hypothetical protein